MFNQTYAGQLDCCYLYFDEENIKELCDLLKNMNKEFTISEIKK